MKIPQMFLVASVIWVIAGCGDQPGIPDMAGPWSLTLTPHAASSSAPLPGVSLAVTFTQDSNTLSGTLTSVDNQSQACLQDLSSMDKVTISGRVMRPGGGDVPPLNLSLTLDFVPSGSSGTKSILLNGGIANGTQTVNGIYQIQGASADCLEGMYTLTRTNRR